MAVAKFSHRTGLTLLVAFTSDRQQAAAAVEGLGFSAIERRADPLNLAYDLGAPLTSGLPDPSGLVSVDDLVDQEILAEQAAAMEYAHKVKFLMDSLSQLAHMLGAVQGRKQVIYLSEGFSGVLGGQARQVPTAASQALDQGRAGVLSSSDNHFGSGGTMGLARVFKEYAVADTLIHSVDLTGLGAAGTDASQQLAGGGSSGAGQDSLAAIATGTGGIFYKNGNNPIRALQDVLDSTRHFYVLAFEPARSKGLGKVHKLKVEVNGAGRVSHRTAYVEAAGVVRDRMAAQLQAAEVLAKGLSGVEIEVHALAIPECLADGRLALSVVLQVDGPSLLDRDKGEQLPVEVYGYALDANGRIEDTAGVSVLLDLAKVGNRVRQRGLMVQTAFAVEPGTHTLRFLVRAGVNNRQGSTVLETVVPDLTGAKPRLSRPILLDEGNEWIPLRARPRSGASVENPFRVDGDSFAPSARARLTNGKVNRIFMLSCDAASVDASGVVEAAARLMRDGTEVPLGPVELLKSSSDGTGYRRYVLGITPQNVPPGDYRLVVSLADGASGAMQETEQTVSVR